ncbi:PQQ-binding-like beta-propeller repeat protein [Streptomyces sp. NPDC002730]|uniref:serine/threonine-protein kinase n=1 Tax=Streptomyces sp. NPDC002730 TaxID=3364662 RepID=UPI003674EF04
MNPLGPGDPLRLGPYRLVGVLGAGGMGRVYFGHDSQGRAAAIKVLLPQLAHDQHLVQRFLREAEAARAVTSKGVARVLAAQTEGGRPWIASEFLAGPTLDQAVQAYGPLAEPALRALAASLADTLQDIHATGLIHRDLKPSNIVLTSRGPRIIDFGIARPEHGLTLTTTGQTPVTPGYGAPEQVLGQRVGTAADVFSLGAVLVYAASGRQAYEGAHVAAVQYEVVHGQPSLGHIPEHLRVLIGPCLAKDAAHRPLPPQIRTAFAPPRGAERIWRQGPMAADIQHREADAKAQATLPGTVVAAAPSRRRLLVGLAAGAAVLAAGGGTTAWLMGSGKEDDGADKNALKTSREPVVLWGPLKVADVLSPPPLPVGGVVVVGMPDEGIAAYDAGSGKQRWAKPDFDAQKGFLALPGGLVLASSHGETFGLDPSTGTERSSDYAGWETLIAMDDESLYVHYGEEIRCYNLATRKQRWIVPSPIRANIDAIAQGAVAGNRLALYSATGDAAVLDSRTGKKVWARNDLALLPTTPAIHKDLVLLGNDTLKAVRLSDGKEVWSISMQGLLNKNRWSPATVSGAFVYAIDGNVLHCRRVSDGAKVWTHELKFRTSSEVGPLVHGRFVYARALDDPALGVAAVRKDTGERAWFHPQEWPIHSMSAEGDRLFLLTHEELTVLSVPA